MKFIHIADIHASKERKEQTVLTLNKLIQTCKEDTDIRYCLISGDFWDSTITNTESSGFAEIIKLVGQLNNVVPVIMIYGTPSHEPDGSLEVFKVLGCTVIDKISALNLNDLSIIAIPEPRRSRFISRNETESTNKIKDYLESISSLEYNKNNPVVVMYHGEIMGAFYQNGTEATSPIALSKEQLQNINASYYACGHIHMPQMPFKNCYYSGSSCPIDMGETHNAGFNLVTINNGNTDVKRVLIGFPVNKTIEVTLDGIEELKNKDFTNVNLKLKLSCKDRFDTKALVKELKEKTNANKVIIQFILPVKTNIRAEEIISQKSICDKFKTYCSVNGIKASDSIIKKLTELEDTMLIQYAFPKHSFELISLSLKGAVGLTKKEEIFIDFSQYNDGVLVLAGENGAGKTTIIENCHPYPRMLTRSGKLIDHFYLKDSHRMLVYKDEEGLYYRITISMAANIKTGITKYFVETGDGENWKPVPECDGNLDSYKKYIDETFGSIEIFLRTSFFAKEQVKDCPDIAFATKGERMSLFAKLAGLDYYSTLCKSAKDIQSEIDKKIELQEHLLERKTELYASESNYKTQLNNANVSLAVIEVDIKNEEAINSELVSKDNVYKVYLEKRSALRDVAKQLQQSIEDTEEKISDIKNELNTIEKVNQLKDDIDAYKGLSDKVFNLSKENESLSNRIQALYEQRFNIASELSSLQTKINNLQVEESNLKNEIGFNEHEIRTISSDDKCPTCGAELSNAKKEELKLNAVVFIDKNKQLNTQVVDINNKIKELSSLRKETSDKELSVKSDIESLTKERSVIEDKIKFINESISDMKNRGIDVLADFSPKYNNHNSLIERFTNDIESYKQKIKGQVITDIPEDVHDKLNLSNEKLSKLRSEYTKMYGTVRSCESILETIATDLAKMKEAEKTLLLNKSESEDYKVIVKALSNTGIQALELEAIVPTIKNITNTLLEKSYGTKFTVSFETQREGSKKNLIEDFNIVVTNSESGLTYPISLMSSGELVWVKQALYHAFSIIRSESSGFSFRTRFMDECDGSLDGQKRVKYFNMVNATHIEGNARLTVLISHSTEIISIAEQIYYL